MKTSNLKHAVMATAFAFAGASSLALADIVVVVGAKSPVTTLTEEQVSRIFLGKVGTFPAGEPAVPIDQAENSAARSDFYAKVTSKTLKQLNAYRSNLVLSGKGVMPKEVTDNEEVKKLVALNPNMIGYIDKSAADASVKVIFSP